MIIHTHRNFDKKFKKLKSSEKLKFFERRNIFINDQFNSILNNHALKGNYEGCRSINIGGNLRAVFKTVDNNMVLFVDIDTHSNLYE